jgi:hypothetical protein
MGDMTLADWEEMLLEYARTSGEFGIELGNRSELGSQQRRSLWWRRSFTYLGNFLCV